MPKLNRSELDLTQPILFDNLGPRKVVADFNGGDLSSDGGVLLLRQIARGLGVSRAGGLLLRAMMAMTTKSRAPLARRRRQMGKPRVVEQGCERAQGQPPAARSRPEAAQRASCS